MNLLGVALIAAAAMSAISPADASGGISLTFETFDGPAGSPPNPWTWVPLTGGGGWGNHELQSYTNSPSNVSLDGNGNLAITARRQTYTGADGITSNYTSARIVDIHPFQYGIVAARIYVPEGQGLWPAFWTVGADLPQVGWPQSGEIDIMEAKNSMAGVLGSIHGPDPVHQQAYGISKYEPAPDGSLSGWHTYAINWLQDKIEWYLDGHLYQTLTKDSLPDGAEWAFDKPHAMQLNLAVGGDWPGAPDSTTPDVATMLVDWVVTFNFG